MPSALIPVPVLCACASSPPNAIHSASSHCIRHCKLCTLGYVLTLPPESEAIRPGAYPKTLRQSRIPPAWKPSVSYRWHLSVFGCLQYHRLPNPPSRCVVTRAGAYPPRSSTEFQMARASLCSMPSCALARPFFAPRQAKKAEVSVDVNQC